MAQVKLYDYELKHMDKLRKLAPECMVLLKSDGSFPLLKPEKIAVYGNGARHTIKGGTGSGDVNVRHYVTIEEGLENAGFIISTKAWMDAYDACYEKARKEFKAGIKAMIAEQGLSAIMLGIGAVMPEPEYEFPIDGEGEVAIYVLSRISGEGSDRQNVKGDFMMSDTEIRDIRAVSQKYSKFMLVLNVGGVVDISPVIDEVSNVLLLSQTGMTVGDSFADVLLGKNYPSGKLASTWAKYEEYCHVGDFAEVDDTRYKEGIYVGYRYFDTVGKKPMFPFGYGISFTTFDIESNTPLIDKTKIKVSVKIKNTGNCIGKEVVQLYVTVPEGNLNQPYQVLAAYAKTKELQPEEEGEVELTFRMEELASFDTERSAYVLEKGDYILRVGNSSQDTTVLAVVRILETVVVKQVEHVGGESDFSDYRIVRKEYTADSEGIDAGAIYLISKDAFEIQEVETSKVSAEVETLVSQFSDEELAYTCIGGFQDEGSKSFIGNAAYHVAGAAGETAELLSEKGIGYIVMADGPAGLRLSKQYGVDENGMYSIDNSTIETFVELLPKEILDLFQVDKALEERYGEVFDQYCSAIPIGTAIAQSWNDELAEHCGDLVGAEMERFSVDLWLAPALNIHRNPLCGRNFEYYSEDPLISGKMAAAITRGVQNHEGKGVTVKHYVANNQETNRMYSNSMMSERTLRDIYLKGFEIAIKDGKPMTVMSSYNLLNGEHTSSRRDLLEVVLRQEWGFDGVVMSDWVTQGLSDKIDSKYPRANAVGAIAAGNDLMMPGGKLDIADVLAALTEEVKGYRVTREQLETSAGRIITLIKKMKRG